MAKLDIVMPQMGESITTGTITKWSKKVGDIIELDEILLEISTDKVESEIPAPIKGKIVALFYKEGDTVDVGKKIAVIDDNLEALSEPQSGEKQTAIPLPADNKNNGPSLNTETKKESQAPHEKRFYTPLVRALAKEAGLDLKELNQVKGSGAGDRVNRADFEKYLEGRQGKNINPNTSTLAPTATVMPSSQLSKEQIVPMDNLRKTIARNMIQSKMTSPHVNSISEVDLTHLVKFREKTKDYFQKQEGFNLTYTPFIAYALIHALKQFPIVNSSVQGDNIIIKKDINFGFAVSIPGNGLVVPVVKNADSLNLIGIARSINTLANKARNKKLTLDDLSGGTFTYTNVGSFGTLCATPIILQPQVAIYASGVIQKRVVVLKDDSIAVRSLMYGTHTYDHRIIDGEVGGKFLEAAHDILRNMNPEALL